MAQLFDADGRYLFYGIILIALSIVFLISSLGFFKSGFYVVSQEIDFVLAFIFVIIGCGMVFSAAGKPGKPSFNVGIKEIKTG